MNIQTTARHCRVAANKLGAINRWAPGIASFPTTARFSAVQARYLTTAEPLNPSPRSRSSTPTAATRRRKKSEDTKLEKTEQLLQNSGSWTVDAWRAAEGALQAWTRRPETSRDSVHWSFLLLDRMVKEAENQPKDFLLTTRHLNSVLDHWRIATRKRGVVDYKRWSANRVLRLVEDYSARVPTLQLDTKTFSMIMAVQIKHNPAQSPDVCSKIVHRMKASEGAPPNAITLTYLMDAHVKGGQANATFATQSIFDFMVEKAKDDSDLAPTEKSLTQLLQAWVCLSDASLEEAVPHMKRALDYMITASKTNERLLSNSLFLNLVLERLSELEDLVPSIYLADALMTMVLEAKTERPCLMPDAKAFSRIISLWSKSRAPDAPTKAEYWLGEMYRLSKEYESLEPRASLYTATIAAWEKSGLPQAPHHGDVLRQQMVERTSEVTAGGYYMLLSLWSKSGLPEAPTRSEELLNEMLAAAETDARLTPSCQVFVNVISAWRRSVSPEAANRAHIVLDRLLEEKRKHPDAYLLNDVPFNAVLHAWAESGSSQAEQKADEIIEFMGNEARRNAEVRPSIMTAWSALQCLSPESEGVAQKVTRVLRYANNDSTNTNQYLWDQVHERALFLFSQSPDHEAPQMSELLFQDYIQCTTKGHRRTEYVLACISHITSSWKRSGDPAAVGKMEFWLAEMLNHCEAFYKRTGNSNLHVKVVEGWANSGLYGAGDQIEEIVTRQMNHCASEGSQLQSNWYTSVIVALLKCGKIDRAEMVMENWRSDKNASMASGLYTPVLKALIDSSQIDRATQLLEEMIHKFIAGHNEMKPDVEVLGSLMSAYAVKGAFDRVDYLWSLLQQLQRHRPGDKAFQANSDVLLSLCNSPDTQVAREDSILHLLLENMRLDCNEKMEISTFHSVMDALVRSGDPSAGRRTEVMLLKMQELYDEGRLSGQPTFETFQKVIDCWATCEEDGAADRAEEVLRLAEKLANEGDDRLRPDGRGYMSVIRALSRSHCADAPLRIQGLMRQMQDRHESGDYDFALVESSYLALMEAYANSGHSDAAKLAQVVFDKTPQEWKNTELYNALIGAQGGDSTSAEAILQNMRKGYIEGATPSQPNTETFNRVLLAWSRSGSPMAAWRVDGLFRQMDELSRNGRLPVFPNGRTFDIVISTVVNEFGADGALKVDGYLELLKEYYRSGEHDCVPSIASYTEAIRAWGSNIEDPRAVLRAKALLDEMHELAREGVHSVQPDQNTYSVYLQALSKSTTESKAELARDVASSMYHNGIVPKGLLLSYLQRCWLPSTAVLSSWTVPIDASVQEQEFAKFA